MPTTNGSKTIYALIIGINAYPKNQLYGCVNDALDVHQFCRQLADANPDITDYQPKFLLAPHPEDMPILRANGIKNGDYIAPTRANIIAAFSHFKQASAEREDICLMYYSGHGSYQSSPELFWQIEPSKQVQTLVCQDSRTRDGRDLIDKELAYLLWDALHDKVAYESGRASVHPLLIFDCCHSGDITRGDDNRKVRSRMETANPERTPLKDYEGYKTEIGRNSDADSDQRFLAALEKWRSLRYLNFSAAREKETAKETELDGRSSGVFTYSLLKTLRNAGFFLSCNELMERVKVMVRNRVEQQIPVLFATEKLDGEELNFLGEKLQKGKLARSGSLDSSVNSPFREYLVSYNEAEGVWKMHAGANAGIVFADDTPGATTVKVWRKNGGSKGTAMEVKVRSVSGTESLLDGSGFSEADQQHEDWIASIGRMPLPVIRIWLDPEMDPSAAKVLQEATGKIKKEQRTFEWVTARAQAEYIAYHLSDEYVLSKKDSNVPVFKRNASAQKFIAAIQNVSQWMRLQELNNPATAITREALDLEVQVIEGVPLGKANLNTAPAKRTLENPTEINLSYTAKKGSPKDQVQPAIRVRFRTTSQAYYVSCLYMDSKYGITSNLDSVEISPEDNGEWLKFSLQGIEYRTIPISFDTNYHKLGISEITDYLKIFVSTQQFQVKNWEQGELELDDKLIDVTRGGRAKGIELEGDDVVSTEDWTSFLIPIKIRRPLIEQELSGTAGQKASVSLGGATVQAPAGFSAKVAAASEAEVQDLIKAVSTRSVGQGNQLRKTLLPSPALWGGTIGGNAIFTRSVGAAGPDTQLSILELTDVSGADQVSADNPLIFEPDGGLDKDEVLVSFGYDPDTDMYLPLGFSDETGQVVIEQLPKETSGKIIGEEAITERSLKGSIKLFFKKVVIGRLTGQSSINTLALCSRDENGLAIATKVGDGVMDKPELRNICLLIHGIIGDTEGQRKTFFEHESELYKKFDAVLSYDYENLNTPIEETARQLKKDLAKAGITATGGQRLTIVAHSMGGLVSRWFIEQEGGQEMVSRLIQLGTPNGGSETADFRKSVFSMLSMAMNGAGFLKPYLPVLSFIGKHVTRAVFLTLDQMSPKSSEFLKKLNADGIKSPEGVSYWIIGGNTNDIQPDNLDADPLWKQFWRAFKTRAPYMLLNKLVFNSSDPNDIAVTQTSMQRVPTQRDLPFYSVACDHLSYFNFEPSVKKLQEIIGEGSV